MHDDDNDRPDEHGDVRRRRPPRRGLPRVTRRGWLHLCNGLDPVRDGGMVPSILGMTGALSRLRGEVTIVTPTPSRLDGAIARGRLDTQRPGDRPGRGGSLGRGRASARALAGPDAPGRRGGPTARVPYLVAAHGMAEPWALRHKRWKKRVYLALVEAKNLRRASCLHALSRPEIGHLRSIAPWTPICFVPNGVDLALTTTCPPSVARGRTPRARGEVRPAVLRTSSRQEGPRPAGRRPGPDRDRPTGASSRWSPATTTEPGPRFATGWPSFGLTDG